MFVSLQTKLQNVCCQNNMKRHMAHDTQISIQSSSPQYMTTPFTAVFQYRRCFASPESGGIGGRAGGRMYIVS